MIPNLPTAMPTPPAHPGLASPGTVPTDGVRGPESQTLVASPLADRIGGLIQHQQMMAQASKMSAMLGEGLRSLSQLLRMSDPKTAAKFEKMAADLSAKFPSMPQPPQTPGGVQAMAGQLPPGGSPGTGFPPPAIPGTNAIPQAMMGPPPGLNV